MFVFFNLYLPIMKIRSSLKAFLIFSLSIFSITESQASPLLTIGDDLNVFFNGSTTIGYDSNITLDDSDEASDVFLLMKPGIEFDYGRGNANLNAIIGANIIAYLDESDYDSTTGFFRLKGGYEGARLSLNSHASIEEIESNTNNINVVRELVRRRVYTFGIDGNYELTEKVELESGFNFISTDYRNFEDTFNDEDRYSIPFNIYYAFSPKLDLSAGYRYTRTDVTDDNDRNDHFFNLGFRGEVAPKLEGQLKAGYRYRDISGDSNTGTLGIDSDLRWAFSPLTSFTLGAKRDFDTGGRGESLRTTETNFKVIHAFTPLISGEGTLRYKNYTYTDSSREDDNYSYGATLFYQPIEYLAFSFGYTFLDNDSNLRGASYRAHRVLFTIAVRY